MLFAWTVVKYVKSNAIIFCKDKMTIGVGAGQMSRVYSTKIAAIKAADEGLDVDGFGHGVRRILSRSAMASMPQQKPASQPSFSPAVRCGTMR